MTLKTNANNWVLDRKANKEALMFNEFRTFMIRLGNKGKDVDKLKTQMKRKYGKGYKK